MNWGNAYSKHRPNIPIHQLYHFIQNDMSVLQEPPFTDRGSVVDIFTDVTIWLGIRAVIDQINTNAAAQTR